MENRPYVCPAEFAGSLDNILRRLVHKPLGILGPYIREGMTVLDFGCGPGYFTAELAKLAGKEGTVIAADIQQKMLDKAALKVSKMGLERTVLMHLCSGDTIGISRKVDFVLAFWMIHEVPDQTKVFRELKSILNPGGRILVVEPRIHVTLKSFNKMISRLDSAGLVILESPVISLSRSVLAGSAG